MSENNVRHPEEENKKKLINIFTLSGRAVPLVNPAPSPPLFYRATVWATEGAGRRKSFPNKSLAGFEKFKGGDREETKQCLGGPDLWRLG